MERVLDLEKRIRQMRRLFLMLTVLILGSTASTSEHSCGGSNSFMRKRSRPPSFSPQHNGMHAGG
jgi:hypothetical protein